MFRKRYVTIPSLAVLVGACSESNPVIEADPVPVVSSVSITRERSDAMVALMEKLPPGTRVRRAEALQVSSDLGGGVVATAFLEGAGERRVFAPGAPAEADIALGYLVELERADGQASGRVDLRSEDVARYGVFAVVSERGQALWRAELADVMRVGAIERVGELDIRVARQPRALRGGMR